MNRVEAEAQGLSHALDEENWREVGWRLWNIFILEDRASDLFHFADLVYISCSRKERAEMENI